MKPLTRVLTLVAAVALIGSGALLNRWLGPTPTATAVVADAPASSPIQLAEPRPTLMQFGMDSCASCRAMKPELERLRVRYPTTLHVVSVNLMEQRALAEQWQIRAMPTQILLDASGNEIARHLGFISADAIDARFVASGVPLSPSLAMTAEPASNSAQ